MLPNHSGRQRRRADSHRKKRESEQQRVQRGEALGFGRGGRKATVVTPDEFLQRQTGDLDDRIEKLQAAVQKEVSLRNALIEKTEARVPALRKARGGSATGGCEV